MQSIPPAVLKDWSLSTRASGSRPGNFFLMAEIFRLFYVYVNFKYYI